MFYGLEANVEARLIEMRAPGSSYGSQSLIEIVAAKTAGFEFCKEAYNYKAGG